MYKYKILDKVEHKEWNSKIKENKLAVFFQNSEFLNSKSSYRFPLFIYIYNETGDVKGQLGLRIVKSQHAYSTSKLQKYTQIISKLGNRGTWVFGPIIHEKEPELRSKIIQKMILALEEIEKKHNLMIIDGYSPPEDNIDESYVKEFLDNGYSIKKFITFRINLSKSIDEIWKNIDKSARNDIGRASRCNVVAKEIQKKDELKGFNELAKEWAKTKGIEIKNPHEELEKDWRDYKNGIQKFFLAYENGRLISGLRLGCFNGISYIHQVLNAYSKASSLGGPLLTWYTIKWAKKNNMRIYDVSGVEATTESNKNDKKFQEQWSGLTKYKKKWGGEVIPYYHFLKVRKKRSQKLFRVLTHPDRYYQNFKKIRFKRPQADKNLSLKEIRN